MLQDSQELMRLKGTVRTDEDREELWRRAAGAELADWRQCQRVFRAAEAAVESAPQRERSEFYAAKDTMLAAHARYCRKIAAVDVFLSSQESPKPLMVRTLPAQGAWTPKCTSSSYGRVLSREPSRPHDASVSSKLVAESTQSQAPTVPVRAFASTGHSLADAVAAAAVPLLCALSQALLQVKASTAPAASEEPQQRSTRRRRLRGKGGAKRAAAPSGQ